MPRQDVKSLGDVNPHVGWSPGGNSVQMGLVLQPEDPDPTQRKLTLVRRLLGDKHTRERIGLELLARREHWPDLDDDGSQASRGFVFGGLILDAIDDVSPFTDWWTGLDRASVNRLIRLLRRARDSAFGVDA